MKKGLGLSIIGVGVAAIAGGIITLLKGGNIGLPQVNAEADDYFEEELDDNFEESSEEKVEE